MKIAFISDYFYPYEISGAEISTRILAHALARQKIDVSVITPNYSNVKPYEMQGSLKIIRFPFFNPFITDNPLWFLYSAFIIWQTARKINPELIHVHNKNLLIGTYLANLILRKKLVVTVRDYRMLCYFGTCLLSGDKVCTPREYFQKDIRNFIKLYNQRSLSTYAFGFYEFFLRQVYKHILKKVNLVICISQAEEKIYNEAGVTNTKVIYNMVEFKNLKRKKEKQVIFVGRFTPGKGKAILEELIPWFLAKYPDWKFLNLGAQEKISNSEVLNTLASSSFTIVPSIWPEPFGRAALESISVNTPVLASNRGGLPEIVAEKYGLTVKPNLQDFKIAILKMAKDYKKFSENIKADKTKIRTKFFSEPLKQHINLYKFLC